MFLRNTMPEYRQPLLPADAATLSVASANEVERYLTFRDNHAPTPLVSLPGMAALLGVASIHLKDEGQRLRPGLSLIHISAPTRPY